MSAAVDRFLRLDRADLRILDALQQDGRITNQRLAQIVSLSPSACLARVRSLERRGVITGYSARVAIETIRPTMTLFAEVTMKRHLPHAFDRFEAFLAGIPEIIEAHRVSGAFDYLMKIVVTDTREWRELAIRLLGDEHGIEKITTHIIMAPAKEATRLPLIANAGA